jgi:predicted transcriptional regulator
MVPKRSKLEIYLDILKVLSRGLHKPTRIMYSSNLSWNPLTKALESMIEQGFIRKEEYRNRSTYYLTKKGKETMEYWNKATKLIEVK